jgi:signal transduction histidine kinase
LLYAALVLLAAIPLFYFITQALCVQDVDEALRDRKKRLSAQLLTHDEIINNLPWHDLSNETIIYPAISNSQADDSITLQRYNTLNREQEPFRELHTHIKVKDKVYPIILRISMIGTEDLIQGIVITETLLMFLILGGLLYINRVQSRKIWQPFYQALDQLQRFTLDKRPDLQFMPTDINEFKDLQQASRLLAERTYRTYLQQKEFTENAAHEMQTPLASMQAILEVMMQDEQLTPEEFIHVQELQDIVTRISRLDKGLLLLAKIENKQYSEVTPLPAVPVIKKILTRLEMQIHLKQIILSENYEDCTITANTILLDILLSNLLHNAVQHCPEKGQIHIMTFPNRIEVANTGEALAFHEEKLFRRFQKNPDSQSAGGNGLGLAIVYQICRTFHYTISYQYKKGFHHFMLSFS